METDQELFAALLKILSQLAYQADSNLIEANDKAVILNFYVNIDPPISGKLLGNRERAQLRRILTDYFDESEICVLCFDLGIDEENLSGETKPEKVIALIKFCENHGLISELLSLVKDLRRDLSTNLLWIDVYKPNQEYKGQSVTIR